MANYKRNNIQHTETHNITGGITNWQKSKDKQLTIMRYMNPSKKG